MSDYIKSLEGQIEELNKKLAQAEFEVSQYKPRWHQFRAMEGLHEFRSEYMCYGFVTYIQSDATWAPQFSNSEQEQSGEVPSTRYDTLEEAKAYIEKGFKVKLKTP